jgi:hypothetical protein
MAVLFAQLGHLAFSATRILHKNIEEIQMFDV